MMLGEVIDKLLEVYEVHGDMPCMIKIEMEDKLLLLIAVQPVVNSLGNKSVVMYGGLSIR